MHFGALLTQAYLSFLSKFRAPSQEKFGFVSAAVMLFSNITFVQQSLENNRLFNGGLCPNDAPYIHHDEEKFT